MRNATAGFPRASVDQVADEYGDPFRILISTMISLRTKDEVTLAASRKLFAVAGDAASLAELDVSVIEKCIFPAGFYRTKAKNLRQVARMIMTDHGGSVPDTLEALLELPGVGVKTANLVLGMGYGIPAICVDTHVHRIFNRLGIISTLSPDETESALRARLPERMWIGTNGLFVLFGQRVCTPTSPHCTTCPFSGASSGAGVYRCPRVGVAKFR